MGGTLTIKNCRILENNRLIAINIFIKNGKIAKIGEEKKADKVIDAKGKLLLPGTIDCHVHFREPGFTHKENFLTGSKAAAAGGITTIIDMPNTNPPTLTLKELKAKRGFAKKSIVNYGFHFGSSTDNLDQIKKAKNIASVKIFFDISTGRMLIEDDEIIQNIFKNSKTVATHAEGENVKKAINFSRKSGNRLYLCHITTRKELSVIKKAKKEIKKKIRKGEKTSRVFAEATPHHLFLIDMDVSQLRSFGLMKPSLKCKPDRKALWKALNKGLIDTIGTDHAPHTIEEKKSSAPPFGVPGEETLLPLMLDAVNKRKIKLSRLIELICHNPARIFGIKNKGFIKEGYDADLVLVDMNLVKIVDNKKLFTRCKWSPFNGWKLKGWPVLTIVNGNIVFENSKIKGKIKGKEVKFI